MSFVLSIPTYLENEMVSISGTMATILLFLEPCCRSINCCHGKTLKNVAIVTDMDMDAGLFKFE